MTIDVTNNIPEMYIVGETKINPQTLERFFKETRTFSVIEKWNNINGGENISALEQHIELMARGFQIDPTSDQTNKEYLNDIIKSPGADSVFDHGNVTVIIRNASLNFLILLLRLRLDNVNIINSKMSLEEIGFWLPPLLDNPDSKEYALKFANGYSDLSKAIDTLLTSFNYETLVEENEEHANLIRQVIVRLLPISTQMNIGLTCSVKTWRNMMLMGSRFGSDDELRYAFMHLAKDMKKRYFNLFQDFKLQNQEGKTLGLDSLRTDGAWYNYQLVSVPN